MNAVHLILIVVVLAFIGNGVADPIKVRMTHRATFVTYKAPVIAPEEKSDMAVTYRAPIIVPEEKNDAVTYRAPVIAPEEKSDAVTYRAPVIAPEEKSDAVTYIAPTIAWLDPAGVTQIKKTFPCFLPVYASARVVTNKYLVNWTSDRDMIFPELRLFIPAHDSYLGYKDQQIKALCESGNFAAAAEEARRFIEMWKSSTYLINAPNQRGGKE
jgi:hypothetical protein